jgi:hypothetical protein
LAAPQLISFAMGQIEQDTIRNMIKNGKNRQLSDLEKGRAMIKFMNMKSDPFKNRHFYNYYYKEQEKNEHIEVMLQYTYIIAGILEPNDAKLRKSLS